MRTGEHMALAACQERTLPPAQPGTSHQMSGVDWGLLLLLGLVWGGTFYFGKVALALWPPFTVVLGRIVIGALLLNLVVMATGHRLPRDGRTWRALLVMGLLNSVIPFSLIVSGQTQITSGLAAILYATTSLFTVLLAPIFVTSERLGTRLLGVTLGLAGVVIMLGPEALRDPGSATWPNSPYWVALSPTRWPRSGDAGCAVPLAGRRRRATHRGRRHHAALALMVDHPGPSHRQRRRWSALSSGWGCSAPPLATCSTSPSSAALVP